MGANSFLNEMAPVYMGGNNENERVSSPENVYIYHKHIRAVTHANNQMHIRSIWSIFSICNKWIWTSARNVFAHLFQLISLFCINKSNYTSVQYWSVFSVCNKSSAHEINLVNLFYNMQQINLHICSIWSVFSVWNKTSCTSVQFDESFLYEINQSAHLFNLMNLFSMK